MDITTQLELCFHEHTQILTNATCRVVSQQFLSFIASYVLVSLWNAIVDKNPIFSMHIYIYIVQFLIFNSTLNCPIQPTKFLFNICISSQFSNSLVQILAQFTLQLSIFQLTSPNPCPILNYTSTLNCSTHKSKFLFNFNFNSQLSNSLI